MGEPTAGPPGRLAAVGAVVVVANAGLLVLQLVAGRLLAPFVGSSLETWTAVIAAFLTGIALGNAAGGPLADRFPRPRTLAAVLLLGAVSALWMLGLPLALDATGWHRPVPLGGSIPLLAALLCLPPGFALSLLTPVAIRLGLTDVAKAGRAAGLVFALSAVGCLAGNYLTGFVLIPALTVNAIVAGVAGLLVLTAAAAARLPAPTAVGGVPPGGVSGGPVMPLRTAFAVVFLASFAGMALELAASRVMAQVVGVSLYSWTGVIGVMLAGTAAGNWVGGRIAGSRERLTLCLVLAAVAGVLVLAAHALLSWAYYHPDWEVQQTLRRLPLVAVILVWTFAVFFLPMFALGTVSPQVVRLATADLAHAGRTAGRVYAVSTAGAIAGTLLTGFVLISTVGMYRTVLLAAALTGLAAVLAGKVWRSGPQLYLLSVAGGGVVGGLTLVGSTLRTLDVVAETNYYAIRVTVTPPPIVWSWTPTLEPVGAAGGAAVGLVDPLESRTLVLDRLIHSEVKPADPAFLFYPHEHVQMEFLRAAGPTPRALVVGGGGYSFPRCARTFLPASDVDVVEIDPGVTRVAYSHLGLDPALGIRTFNRDGRQFVAEQAAAGGYDVVTLDAVNDLSVPAHLLTKECNDAVKRILAPGGVYLVTVIDEVAAGRLWKAVHNTLAETFPHVALLASEEDVGTHSRSVLVLYAGDRPPVPPGAWAPGRPAYTTVVPAGTVAGWLAREPKLVLTDQFAPVDNLMAGVFRRR